MSDNYYLVIPITKFQSRQPKLIRYLYIKSLKYSHLTHVFDYSITIWNFLETNTNLNGYCVLIKPFKCVF